MTLDPRIPYLVLIAIAAALLVIVGVKLARYVFRNDKAGPNGERRSHPVVRALLNGLPFVPIVIFGIIGGKIALDIKNQTAPPPASPVETAYAQAAKGDAGAQLHLAEMYEKGDMILKDRVEAYFWYSLLAAGGDKNAEVKVAEIGSQLSVEQLESVQKRVENWKPSTQ